MRFAFVMALPSDPLSKACAMWQNARMRHYCYLITEVSSLTLVVSIINAPCRGMEVSSAYRTGHDITSCEVGARADLI